MTSADGRRKEGGAGERPGIIGRRRTRVTLLVLLLLAAGARLPMLRIHLDPSPDGAEYLNVARHMARGDGAILSIKSQLFDRKPVVRSTIGNRGSLYPALVAVGLRAFRSADDLLVARATSGLLSLLGCALCLLLFVRVFGWQVGAPSAALVALNPWSVSYGVEPLSDQLAFTVSVGALAWHAAHRAGNPRWALGEGALAGLGQLARPTGLVLLVTLLAGYLLGRRWRAAGWLMVGFLLVAAPYLYANWRQNGSPFYSVSAYDYAVADHREGTWYGLDWRPTTPGQFVAQHPALVAELMWRKTRENLAVVMAPLGPLLLLLPLLPMGWWRRERGVMLGYACANLLLYCFSWAAVGAPRYLLPSYLLPLPFLLEAARWPRWRRLYRIGPALLALSVGVTVVSFTAQNMAHYQRRSESAQRRSPLTALRAEAAAWVRRETNPDAVVATNNPWLVNYLTERPAVICPRFSHRDQVAPFLREHAVRSVVLFVRPGDARSQLLGSSELAEVVRVSQALEADGWRLVIYRVIATDGSRPSGRWWRQRDAIGGRSA
jgi:4-amino-4-deoxy-L-arabinose transferase-like glycosyltransferase